MSTETKRVRVRLAPSPTGDPHVGTAYIGLFDYVFAKANGGDFVLRIEDTDRERSTKESEAAIFRALRWVGLPWDEGPDVGGPYGPYRQSERAEIYRQAAQALLDSGHAYRCFCTADRLKQLRAEQEKAKASVLGYDRHCRNIPRAESDRRAAAAEPFVIRLAVPAEGETSFTDLIRGPITIANNQVDDQVLLKSDGFPTYHLANVVDDHAMKITHVIRAEEWISSTPKHVLLYQAFGWEAPQFAHMPLLRNTDRSKISKRKNPTSLDWYRAQGYLPEALRNFLGLMGFSVAAATSNSRVAPPNSFGGGDSTAAGSSANSEIFTVEKMIAEFSWDRVGNGAPVFDLTKLQWLNGEYIRAMDPNRLVNLLETESPLKEKSWDRALVRRSLAVAQTRMKLLNDYIGVCAFLFEDIAPLKDDMIAKKSTAAASAAILAQVIQRLEAVADWRVEVLEAAARPLAAELNWKPGDLFMLLRVAVTGSKVSPPLFESMELLGREKTLARLNAAIAILN